MRAAVPERRYSLKNFYDMAIRDLSLILCAGLAAAAVSCSAPAAADYDIVPAPREVAAAEGAPFVLKNGTPVNYPAGNEAMRRNAEFLAGYIGEQTGLRLIPAEGGTAGGAVTLALRETGGNPEGYRIDVTAEGVTVTAPTPAGVFYGIQTLRKAVGVTEGRCALPAATIADEPRFAYRGMHLDVSRHFFTVDEVKRYIDMLALHNINRFHWHLTDDQGWRIEIRKYPRLTEVGSRRKQTVIGHNSGKYDGKPYGGFYTQEEARDIVAYAAERYITVIPEIDLPGHMQAALAAYPELGCTGGPYDVWMQWGISDDVLCAGNDATIAFIKDVLAEVMEIFPSEYIHVGGDECPKVRWESCPKCQARIRALGLRSDGKHTKEQRLQSYVIHEAADFLAAHGRRMIGWDEILEGGLAPGATVMSWRGEGGGIEAARLHHDVIMTPNTYHYFDYYQAKDISAEPEAIGGYLPIERVYSYEPVPRSLTPEEQRHIVGVQANLWTEYIPDFAQVQYMVLPRMAALCETQWCQPDRKVYDRFLRRAARLCGIYDINGWNYATHIFDVDLGLKPDPAAGTLAVTASTIDGAPVHYTLDGSEPTASSPCIGERLDISSDAVLRTVALRKGGTASRTTTDTVRFHKAAMKAVELLQAPHGGYTFGGAPTLADGLTGDRNYKTGRWLGFCGTDLEAVIDLGGQTEVSAVTYRTCVEKGDWIFDSRGATVWVSDDGTQYREAASESTPAMKAADGNGIFTHSLRFDAVKCRYVKVMILSEHSIPDWHGAKGYPGFLFVDEITVE